jgi:predicted  nucleic acid-binding Zn-ribbon protein
MPEPLQQLLLVQERDLALDVLQHRREHLSERAELEAALGEAKTLIPRQQRLREQREAQASEERRLDHEIESVRTKAAEVDAKLYSGTVTSPRELQAMQADLEQLRHHVTRLEDDELEHMVVRETIEGELQPVESRLQELRTRVGVLQDTISESERAIDGEIADAEKARGALAADVPPRLLADYEARRRRSASQQGAARLLGDTCQACRLSIPATEVDQIRHDDTDRVWYCDNCGAILVAS